MGIRRNSIMNIVQMMIRNMWAFAVCMDGLHEVVSIIAVEREGEREREKARKRERKRVER